MLVSKTKKNGSLRKEQGHFILSLQGSAFEIGLQHGLLLREKIQNNIHAHLRKAITTDEESLRIQAFKKAIPEILPYIPPKYLEEMEGLAQGAKVAFSDILLLNLFPEMFHCCAITVSREASYDKTLYHTRVLDYSAGKNLHDSAILMVVKPDNGLAFLNITYAGFIGSVTGMNNAHLSVGEIGGLGYGQWRGMPMAFLLRNLLQEADSLSKAKEMLSITPRTCEYYYIVADGKDNNSFGCYATAKKISFLEPGRNYTLTPAQDKEEDLTLSYTDTKQKEDDFFFKQPDHTLLLTGLTAPERYPILLKKVEASYGHITPHTLMEMIKEPVARPSNLHNAIFHPSSLSVWVTNAKGEKKPACHEPYALFNLSDLLKKL